MPRAPHLNVLPAESRNSELYFYSLPPETRRGLSARGGFIRTADELRRQVDFLVGTDP